MNTNKKGFTLIELLVVIVIIGILATISVATFGGYFKKARDAERQSTVQNIATIMKVINATNETVDYSSDGTTTISSMANLNTVLSAQGYSVGAGKNEFCYNYGYLTASPHSEFFIATGSEETAGDIFSGGTPAGVAIADADANIKVNTVAGTCNTLTAGTTGTYTVVSF